MSPPPALLGPPEIHGISTTITTPPPTLHSLIIKSTLTPQQEIFYQPIMTRMGLTENGSATFLSTGNPCLDFFFHIVPDTPDQDLVKRLELSWKNDALTTLKLICNLRGVRGTGKSEKEGFYTSSLWLHYYHPKTLACNVKAIADFGYFKDVLEILYRLVEGPDVRKNEKEEWTEKKNNGFLEKKERSISYVSKGKAKKIRLEKIMDKAKKLLDRYDKDCNFKFLYDKISGFFADQLREDMKLYNEGKYYELSLAAKWCPSLDSSYDKSLLMCESIGRKLFPREDYIEYQDLEDAHYAYRVRDRLRKEVLVPLHKALEVPEVYICANKWEDLPYKRVPSVAMTLYKKLFYKHDKERFQQYIEDVKSGKTTIAAGALLPHEIIASLKDSTGPEVAELQWERMVSDLAKKGKLTNCMAISDVSGSMSGTPMEVSVALGLLISELSEEPWKGKLITFSSNPEFHIVKGKNLSKKTNFIRRMAWGGNTDFQKVFDKILEVAVKGKLSEEKMIKRVFVFSDMEFDQASMNPWETDYQVIQKKFKKNGYKKVPEIVFWNLRNSVATPVPCNQEGVALVSGFSKNLVTLFLEEGGIMSPEAVMMQAISGEEYQKLVVFD
ncbi:uncharacterized protein LOC132068104 [Lycium ferocissimum]|uniref:uncharacterized protein LOC132068104 n=1 Tax=Lycium ferocissimum TaxID=112874 RepID=UPI00281636AD|nr:uncharacterized protein LOC132068104 [Lycium ferocissimum]